jgi:hypothetical protein
VSLSEGVSLWCPSPSRTTLLPLPSRAHGTLSDVQLLHHYQNSDASQGGVTASFAKTLFSGRRNVCLCRPFKLVSAFAGKIRLQRPAWKERAFSLLSGRHVALKGSGKIARLRFSLHNTFTLHPEGHTFGTTAS